MGKTKRQSAVSETRLTRSKVKDFLDLSASESDGGDDQDHYSSELTDMTDEEVASVKEVSEDELVSVNQPTVEDVPSEDDIPVVPTPLPKRKRLARRVQDEDDEVTALTPNDSMYSGNSVKANHLGPAMATRRSTMSSGSDLGNNNAKVEDLYELNQNLLFIDLSLDVSRFGDPLVATTDHQDYTKADLDTALTGIDGVINRPELNMQSMFAQMLKSQLPDIIESVMAALPRPQPTDLAIPSSSAVPLASPSPGAINAPRISPMPLFSPPPSTDTEAILTSTQAMSQSETSNTRADGMPSIKSLGKKRELDTEDELPTTGTESATSSPSKTPSHSPRKKLKTTNEVVLSDLTTIKVKYDDKQTCGVFNRQLQDPLLRGHYDQNPPLPSGRKLLPSWDLSHSDIGRIGGRIGFSDWADVMDDTNPVPSSIFNAITFIAKGIHCNPSRVNPNTMSRIQHAQKTNQDVLSVGDRPAVFLSCGSCTESHVTVAVASSSTPPRYRKFISLLYHNQDYERYEAFMCLCFNRVSLYTSMSEKAIQMQTLLSPFGHADKRRKSVNKLIRYADQGPSSNSTLNWVPGVTYPKDYKLPFDAEIPVYNAIGKPFNFNNDLENVANLERWHDEIPIGSFCVVAYSASLYDGAARGQTGKHAHLGNNLLWIMIMGTLKDSSDDSGSDQAENENE
ncbi:hypothetical protein B0H13DRAFT_1882593 [Mycena leptocephala]|nr:hypothetical protein B0H13DRAFT_1882593 [Mycena leptocephala]